MMCCSTSCILGLQFLHNALGLAFSPALSVEPGRE
jgi:hypothetical protein